MFGATRNFYYCHLLNILNIRTKIEKIYTEIVWSSHLYAPFNMGRVWLDRVCTKHVVYYYLTCIMYDLCMFIRYLVSITQVLKDTYFGF
jgi:hypothetical protein